MEQKIRERLTEELNNAESAEEAEGWAKALKEYELAISLKEDRRRIRSRKVSNLCESMACVKDGAEELERINSLLKSGNDLGGFVPKWFSIKSSSAGGANTILVVMPTELFLKHLATVEALGGGDDGGIEGASASLGVSDNVVADVSHNISSNVKGDSRLTEGDGSNEAAPSNNGGGSDNTAGQPLMSTVLFSPLRFLWRIACACGQWLKEAAEESSGGIFDGRRKEWIWDKRKRGG